MTQEQEKGIMKAFDLYCKTVLRNKARNLHKELAKKEQTEIPIDELPPDAELSMQRKDQYDFSIPVPLGLQGIEMRLSDPELATAVFRLLPRFRDVLFLAYFMQYSDKEIGELLGESPSTITFRRQSTLNKLKDLLGKRESGQSI